MPVTLTSRLPTIAAGLPARVDGAIREGAERTAEAARQRVPRESNRLHDSIHVHRRGLSQYMVVAGKSPSGGDPDAFYGHMVELGTERVAPQPFLVPAAEDMRGFIERSVTEVLRTL